MQAIASRAAALFGDSLKAVHRRGDRLFAWLMIVQWIAGIAAAFWISPQTWIGATSQTHWHVWAAIFLGGAITSLPVYFAQAMPGRALTRHTIAVAQMLFSALLIHLTGGRMETHFHVFGSLAFLAFYRDWRVLVTATIVVAIDHATRGMLFPQSVFGILTASPWRWIEHAGWVLFEDFFLFISIRQSTRDMIEVAAHRAELEASGEQRLAQSQAMAHIGSWDWNVITNEIIWSDEEYRLFGFAPRAFTPTHERYLAAIHPDDRERTLAWTSAVLANKKPSELDNRTVRPNGEVRALHSQARVILDDSGNVLRLVGTSQDITERTRTHEALERTRAQFAGLVNSVDGIVWEADAASFQFTFVSERAEHILGFPPAQWLKVPDFWANQIHPEDRQKAVSYCVSCTGRKENHTFEYRMVSADERIVWMRDIVTYVEEPGKPAVLRGLMLDITESKQSEIERERAEWQVNIQYEVGRVLAESSTSKEASARLLQVVCENLNWEVGEFYTVDRRAGVMRFDEMWIAPGTGLDAFAALSRETTFAPGIGLPGRVWESGKPLWIPDVLMDDNFPRASAAKQDGLHGAFSFPILTGNEVSGVVEFLSREVRQPDEELLRMFAVLGSQLGQFFERKRAEEALGESEESFRQLAATVTDVFYMTSPDLQQMHYVSPAYEQIWGRSTESLYANPYQWGEAILPDERDGVIAAFSALATSESTVTREFRIKRPDGSIRWICSRGFQVRDVAGKVIRITGIASDVTERKHAEEVLRSSEARFRSMFEHSGVGMVIIDAAGRLLQVNQAYCQFLGYTADELIGLNLATVTDPRDTEETQVQFDDLQTGARAAIELEKRYLRKDGSVVWGRVSAHLLADLDGHRRHMAIVQDITERKAGDQARQQAEEKYRSIFENAAEGIYQSTPQGKFLALNPAAARILGFSSPDQVLERTDRTSFGYVDPRRFEEFMRLVEGQTVVNAFESEVYRPDGSKVWVSENVRVARGGSGEILFFEGTIEDITDRKRGQAEREAISEIVQGVMTTSTLDELLALAHRSIGKLLYAENCFVALHDTKSDLVHFKFWVDKFDPRPSPQPVGRGHIRTNSILRTGQPLVLTKELEARLCAQGAITKTGSAAASWMGVPLRTPTRTIGVLAVQHYEKEDAYSKRDLEFFSDVGDQIALAIERKRADEELKRSEERLAAAQKMAHVGSWEWDVITNKVVWSDEEYRLFGLEPGEGEASYRFYLSLVHPDARKGAMRWFNAVRTMKKSARMDVLIVRPDGQERILNSWADVVLDDNGNVLRIVGTSQDVTEREQAERALGQSEERFQLVSRATDDAIWDWDVVANTLSFSESFGKLFGYCAGEFESTMAFWIKGIHPDDHDALMAGVSAFFAGREEAWSGEYRFRCADGSYAFVFDRGYVVRDGEGNPLRMVGSMMNITERKRAEAERQIISEIAQGVITTSNLDGLLELAHRSIGKLLYAENCFVGLHDPKADLMTFELWVDQCDPVPPPQSHSKGFTRSSYVLRTGQPLLLTKELEAQLFEQGDLDQSGSVAASWLGVPLRTPTRTIGVLVVQHYEKQDAYSQRDLEFLSAVGDQIALAIERKTAEVELRLAKEAAEAANRAKSEFLANMSHEIRTPMNGIIGMTDLALETSLNRDQREYLGMVKSSAHSLLGLINDILDFSKIEAGKLELEAIDFSLRDCIGGMLKPLGIRAHQKGLELVADIHSDVPDHLTGDPARLRQILINLTDNAIKFTEHGEVVVSVSSQPIGHDGESELHFCVSDTGIGIPEKKQAAIFEAFAQADGSTTRTYGGTGLGLSIASQLIQKMGGRIWIESKVGKGTTFHFTGRLGVRATPSLARHAERQDLEGLRALVVDDNAVNRRMLSGMLQNWRMKPTVVESGAAAIEEMTRAANANAAYEVVLLDAMMPEMDGFALAEKINAQPALAGATVMMLSSAMPAGTAERCTALGIAGWLSKPITQSELLNAILLAVSSEAEDGRRRGAEILVAESGDLEKSGLRILVAEDNLINRAVASGILEKAGHALVHAATGREAVEAFSDDSFDLIFMDVQMPEMDGFEATRRIRELEETTGGHITIVAMTAHAMAGDRERCLAAGMDDYVSKPLRKEDLLRALKGAGGQNDEDKNEKIFLHSRAEMLAQCEGDEELMKELVSIFQENTPQIVQSIGDAIEKRDAPALAVSAHKLLSSLGAFGAREAGTLARRLERHGQENDFLGTKERFTELERETDKIYAALA